MREIIGLILLIGWVSGVVLAKGFWMTFATIFAFPYAWYLVIEKLMSIGGLI